MPVIWLTYALQPPAPRHTGRDGHVGRFAPNSTLRALQRALLAPSSRWKKEWVKPVGPSGQSSYRVLKWVKYDEGGETADDGEQPTEEQVTAAVSGAENLMTQPQEAAETATEPAGSESATNLLAVPADAAKDQGSSSGAVTPGISTGANTPTLVPPPPTAGHALGRSSLSQQIPLMGSPAVQARSPADVAEDSTLVPGTEDRGDDMQMEAELREHDVRMVPELVGQEAKETRAALGESSDDLSLWRSYLALKDWETQSMAARLN